MLKLCWKFAVAVVVSTFVSSLSHAVPENCKKEIFDLVTSGPGWGYILEPEIDSVVTNWARQGILGKQNAAAFGKIYLCDACGQPNGSRNAKAEFVNCKGCSQPVHSKTNVHRVFTQSGVQLFHVEAVFFGDEVMADIVLESWVCQSCQNRNDGGTRSCAGCGNKPHAASGSIPTGRDLILIPDSNEISGYRLEPREGQVRMRVKQAGAQTADYFRGPISSAAAATATYVAPVLNPIRQRASQMTRRQWLLSATLAVPAVTGFTWWALTPYVPSLPADYTARGVIVKREILRRIDVYEVKDGKLVKIDSKEARVVFDTKELSNSAGIVAWNLVDPKYAADSRRYRIDPHQEYYVTVNTERVESELPMSATEIQQWRTGDEVELTLAQGQAKVGIRRISP